MHREAVMFYAQGSFHIPLSIGLNILLTLRETFAFPFPTLDFDMNASFGLGKAF
jgi:hypothetical protein